MPLTLPPPGRTALLLDVDGTLLDFAPTPNSVTVPDGLVDALRRLRGGLDDALAVISGRPVDQVDTLLEGAAYAVAGEHGGALRRHPSGALERPDLPDVPQGWFAAAEAIAARTPLAVLERKRRGFVLHYRLAPAAGPALHDAACALVAPLADRFQVLEAAMAWEVRPRGVDKGVAVHWLMQQPPFADRLPLFIGDDVTDEDAIRAADALGGRGLLVGPAFRSAAGVRDWLRRSAAALHRGEGWPPLG